MENVRIGILTAYDEVCAFVDNNVDNALHYYNDELVEYLKGSASTYTFSANAKHPDSEFLVEGNKIAFRRKEKDYYMNVMHVERNENEVTVEAYSLSFELLNEQRSAYKSSSAMSFEQYLAVFDPEHVVTLGINEVSGRKISHEWEGEDTILARLFSLATVFSAELEFFPELNDDYSLKRIVMNVYNEHSDTNQGVGQNRDDITLRYGKDISGITKTSDITELYTAITPTGTDGLTVASLDKTEYDADGNVEYISPLHNPHIYAVQARDRFPSNLMANENERYIGVNWEYDTSNVNTLYGQALAQLKKNCVPKISYTVEGYFDTGIGDTVTIVDESFLPTLYLSARVTEQHISFTDHSQNKTTFDNFEELQSQIDESLLSMVQELIAQNRTYTAMISTDNGIVFRNGVGNTTMTAQVRDSGGVELSEKYEIHWYKDGTEVYIGNPYTISADDVDKKAVYRFEAIAASGEVKAFYEVTVSDVNDGAKGEKGDPGKNGEQGLPGKDGINGKTSYTHIAYANSADGMTDFSVSDPNREYIGIYVDFVETDSANPSDYLWSKIKGADGSQGIPGKAGADGKTPYLHIAYANSADGNNGFSTTDSTNKIYIGQYTDYTQNDSTDPSKYSWSRIKGDKGDQGIPGPAGSDGKTTYFHIKYSDVSNPTSSSQITDIPSTYIGTYVDFTETDSSDPKKYTWSRFQGAQGTKGDQGIPGTNGSDGKTSYLHIAYSNSADGKTGFSVSDSTGKQYIGQYVDFVQTDSTDPSDYNWTKIKGEDGKDGVSFYTWIKYADTPTSGMSDSPDGKKYMGIAYNKESPEESTKYSDYAWSLIIGQGIQGNPGEDGKTLYTWVKYADNAQGSGMSNDPTGKNYIGLAYNKETATESNNPGDYTWYLFRGPQGIPGEDGKSSYIHIRYSTVSNPTSSSQISTVPNKYIGIQVSQSSAASTNPADYTWSKFTGDPGATGATGPAGENGKTPYIHFAYANSADGRTDFSTTTSTGRSYMGQYADYTETDSTDPSKYSWIKVKGENGADGEDGKPTGITVSATEPQNPYTGMLWKHTGTVPGLVKNATYRWNGSSWELYLFVAENLEVDSLSALSADLGRVTAGSIVIPWSISDNPQFNVDGTTEFSNAEGGGNPLVMNYTQKNKQDGSVEANGYTRYGYDGVTIQVTLPNGITREVQLTYTSLMMRDDDGYAVMEKSDLEKFFTGVYPGGNFTGNINTLLDPGIYYCNFSNIQNAPFSGYGWCLNLKSSDTSRLQQVFRYSSEGIDTVAIRYYINSQWYPWRWIPVNNAGRWTAIPLTSGYVTSEGRAPQYRGSAGRVEFRGQVERSDGAVLNGTLGTLPSDVRPATPKIFQQADDSHGGCRVAITTDGQIQSRTINDSKYVSLDGIFYYL